VDDSNVIGELADEPTARVAVRMLEGAGYGPDQVAVITGNPRHARELPGSRSPQGALVGPIAAAVFYGALIAMGGPQMRESGVALAMGFVLFALAGAAIGRLAGRARVFVRDRAGTYERAEDAGDRLASVSVPHADRARAQRILQEAGARRVREEGTVEAA